MLTPSRVFNQANSTSQVTPFKGWKSISRRIDILSLSMTIVGLFTILPRNLSRQIQMKAISVNKVCLGFFCVISFLVWVV